MFPALLLADNTARLTISGYMPPTQRVTAVQSQTVVQDDGAVLLQIQDNTTTGYTVSVQPQPSAAEQDGAPSFLLKQNGRSVTLNPTGSLPPGASFSSGRLGSPTLLEIAPTSNQAGGAVVLTIASQ
jgi:hypothetical protein